MDQHIHLAGLCGSLRKDSYNRMLLQEAVALLPADTSIDILPIDNIPHYNGDLDLPIAKQRPEFVQEFMDTIGRADGILIVSPEYNYSIPGVLKNAIDWASRGGEQAPLLKKPVALMGATPGMWGTVRMQQAFQPIFLFLDMKAVLKPEILIAEAAKKFDANGKLTEEKTKELIRKKLIGLRELALAAKNK